MHLFYAPDIDITAKEYIFSEEESAHCVRVLRLREGDTVCITDGQGSMVSALLDEASARKCRITIVDIESDFEKRGYKIEIGVAPTKNIERLEWFAEKATEIGVDRITPLLCDHSERKIVKQDRLIRVVTSAVKQSLKAYHPEVDELTSFKSFVSAPFEGRKFIAHCDPSKERVAFREALQAGDNIRILIGPEGDFSPQEIEMAVKAGYVGVSLGSSRLRTETAALVAVATASFING